MKIVCDACSAKYSIADDKVKGKVFKIRCKKCSNIIVVRGTAGASDEPPAPQFDQKDTRVYDYGYDEGAAGAAAGGGAAAGEEPVWHLVIDQEQVGPLTVAEVQQRFQQGQIDAESYVWREGFGDWQPLASVDVFAHLAAGGAGDGGGAGAVASMFGGVGDEGGTQRSNPDDLFAAAARGGTTDDAGDDAGDLFGARAAAAPMAARGGDHDDYDKPSSKGGAAAGGKLRGERNENSVLFSLGNLAALASDSPRAAAASSSSSSSSGGGAAQHGGGEGSGLIDIRSMASAYLGPQGAQKKQQSSVGSIDDLPVFSATAFSEPAVIMPAPSGRQSNKTMVILMAAVAALAVITLVLVLVVVLGGDKGGAAAKGPEVASKTGGDDDEKDEKDEKKEGTPEEKKEGTPEEKKEDGTTPPPTDGTTTGPGTTTEPDKKVEEKKPDAKKEEKKDDRSGRDSKKDDKKKEEKVEEKKEEKPSGNCPDEVGCLLSEKPPACCSKYSKGGKKKEEKKTDGGGGGGGGDLPESIDSDMVKSGVGKVKSKIFACGDKYPSAKGTLKLSVKVNAGGSVTDVSVVSSPDAGLGSCAASAMKGAKFPKTQRGGSFKYPFNF